MKAPLWLVSTVGLAVSTVLLGLWVTRPILWPPNGEALALAPGRRLDPIEAEQGHASVLLVGDTHFGESYHLTQAAHRLEADRYDYPLSKLRPLLNSASLTVANLETPLVAERSAVLAHFKDIVHWADPERTASALVSAGVDAASLANNHAIDALGDGLVQTLGTLERHGIVGFGAGPDVTEAARPLRAELRIGAVTLRIAIVGAYERRLKYLAYGTYATDTAGGVYPLSERAMCGQIQGLRRAEPDLFIIAFPHWGSNYAWRSEAQAKLARAMVQAGANVVAGHGAHMFQEVELYDQALVVYSLGNFVFLSPGRYVRKQVHPYSVALRLDFELQDAKPAVSATFYLLASNNEATQYRPYLLEGAEFSRAAELLLSGGTLPPRARARLKSKARFGRDRVGQHLRIELGPFGELPQQSHRRVNRAGAAPVRRSRAP